MPNDTPAPPRWRRWVCHPVFPLVIYLVITQLVRDQYPISHYPMYSKPNAEGALIQFLADEKGQPLPISYHTGLSCQQMCKILGNRTKKYSDRQLAAKDVLKYLRELNLQRPKRPLPARIEIVDTRLAFEQGKLVESHQVLAVDDQPLAPATTP